jgi:hypothetical protein
METEKGVLVVVMVTNKAAIGEKGSLVEVELVHFRNDFKPKNLEAEYDLASLGEVERVRGHYGDPLKWMVEYKGKVSAKRGVQIKPKA